MKKTLMVMALVAFIAACKTTKQSSESATKKLEVKEEEHHDEHEEHEKHSSVKNTELKCMDTDITFSGAIKSILETHCSKCHNSNNKAGYNFLTYASAKKAGEDDHLLGTIKHIKGYDKMPIGAAKLSQVEIDKIECWINSGMPE